MRWKQGMNEGRWDAWAAMNVYCVKNDTAEWGEKMHAPVFLPAMGKRGACTVMNETRQ
jgi:hypothetical protein